MLTDRKLVLVIRKTRLQALKEKYCTLSQAKFYIEHLGESFDDYLEEDSRYFAIIKQLTGQLKNTARIQVLERNMLSTYLFADDDVVIVIGQDGLVANTLKYLNGQPVIAINPLPDLYDGQLLPFTPDELFSVLLATLKNNIEMKNITMAQVNTNLGDELMAVNDFFIGPRTHTSARYQLSVGQKAEEQSSSGVIVSTGLGSTGWFKSILTGASGIAKHPVRQKLLDGFPWHSNYLYYSVREPFPSAVTDCELIFGKITNRSAFTLTSKMAENGVIFSDGIEQDAIEFNAGVTAKITVSNKIGRLVIQ